MIRGYILDDNKVPLPCADLQQWAHWMQREPAARCVASDQTERYLVKTVFLGVDDEQGFGKSDPMLFETTVWFAGGEPGEMSRYNTWNEAAAGHARIRTMLAMRMASADALASSALRAMVAGHCAINDRADTAGIADAADTGGAAGNGDVAGAAAAAASGCGCDCVPIWIIYDHPADYPHCFVARKFLYNGKSTATETVLTAVSLTQIRREVMNAMPQLPNCLDRAPDDDPAIVECWL